MEKHHRAPGGERCGQHILSLVKAIHWGGVPKDVILATERREGESSGADCIRPAN